MTNPRIIVQPWLASVLTATGASISPSMEVDDEVNAEEEEECGNACRACGNQIPEGHTRCGAMECGGGELPNLPQLEEPS